jgi:hypothetical protein
LLTAAHRGRRFLIWRSFQSNSFPILTDAEVLGSGLVD